MDIEQKIKTKLLIRGFSKETLLNNRGLIEATTDETILEVVKNLGIADVSQQRELLKALADNFNESTHTYLGQPMIEETLKAFNCG